MYVSINTLTVSFTSIGFKATVNISRVIVQSTTPEWRQATNLRQTRIKDDDKDEVINFKEIKWGTMRVHADAAYMSESKEIPSTPLRLITNNSMIRLVIKKRMSDCSMVASKLAVILDDILWVLTQSQIIKLSSFVHYIIKLRNKHLPITHQTAAKQEDMPTKSSGVKSQDQLFNAYDIPETSLHLRTHRIDLHLCDDSSLNGNLNKKTEFTSIYDEPGAALQISLLNIGLDHYPYHVVGTKRISTKQDDEMAFQRSRWAHQLLNNFQETEGKRWKKPRTATVEARSKRPPRMYESYFLVRCEDYSIMQVTTPSTHNPQPFLKSAKESLFLPKEMPAIQLDHTTYYYTGSTDLPVPSPNVFVQVNPFQLTFDPLTCVWLNRFTQSVAAGLDWTKEFVVKEAGFAEHVNVRLECLMPKILLPFDSKKRPQQEHVEERPTGLQLLISQTVVTNCRVGAKCAQADVLNDLQSFISSRQYADMSCYPNEKSDFSPYSNSTWLNDYSINCYQLQNLTRRDKDLYGRLKRDNNLPHHIWGIWCDQLWMEFVGVDKAKGRPITFIDAFPVRLWVCQSVSYTTSDDRPISPISTGSSIETAESASESDEFQQSPSLGSRHSQRSSISSENQPLTSSLLQVASGGGNAHQLRPAHSDSDLIDIPVRNQGPRHSVSNTAISGENYAWGGPPPPYGGGGSKNASTTSIENLPPSYDAIASEDPGPISKPPIDVCDNIEPEPLDTNLPTLALLMNVEKTIQIQLDHFQLLSLLRLGENVGSMMSRIELDNKKQTDNQTLEESTSNQDSVILNISVPHVLIDLILAPCIGIDPIQRLSLKERVQYEKEKIEKSTMTTEIPVSGDAYVLPMRSRGRSIMGTSPRSQSLTGTPNPGTPNLSENRKLSGTATELTPESNLQRHLSNSSFNDSLYAEQTYKEVRDAQVQAGDPLVDANLKPSGENQLISVLRIHADNVKVGIQSVGENSIVKVTSNYVNLNELGNMKYGHVLDPRGSIIEEKEQDKQNINMSTLAGDAMLKLRLISGPEAEHFAKDGRDLGFADIRISSLAAALLMSTVDNLTEFGEDEFVQSTMPFKVSISSSDISLYDDKQRRYKSTIKLPPSHIVISQLHVERDSNGVVILNSNAQERNPRPIDLPNNELDTTIGAIGGSYASSVGTSIADTITQQVDALINENGRLVEDLKIVNAKVNGLHSERESLLKVIDKLQLELMLSNNENDDLQKRVRSLTLSKRPTHS
eukprot:TCONS_00022484-protein